MLPFSVIHAFQTAFQLLGTHCWASCLPRRLGEAEGPSRFEEIMGKSQMILVAFWYLSKLGLSETAILGNYNLPIDKFDWSGELILLNLFHLLIFWFKKVHLLWRYFKWVIVIVPCELKGKGCYMISYSESSIESSWAREVKTSSQLRWQVKQRFPSRPRIMSPAMAHAKRAIALSRLTHGCMGRLTSSWFGRRGETKYGNGRSHFFDYIGDMMQGTNGNSPVLHGNARSCSLLLDEQTAWVPAWGNRLIVLIRWMWPETSILAEFL